MERSPVPCATQKQHHQLLRTFQDLKHQDFPDTAQVLVEVGLHACRARGKSEKKAQLAWMQSRLQHFKVSPRMKEAGLAEMALTAAEVKVWLASVLRGANGLSAEGGVTFDEWRNFLSATIQDYLGAALFTANLNKLDNDILRQVRAPLQESLRTVPRFRYAPDYYARENIALERLETLVSTTRALARDVANATPRGAFVLPRKGEEFDEKKHEPLFGCPGKGSQVLLSLFPAYEVILPGGKRDLVEKARVFTYLAKKRKTNSDGSKQ